MLARQGDGVGRDRWGMVGAGGQHGGAGRADPDEAPRRRRDAHLRSRVADDESVARAAIVEEHARRHRFPRGAHLRGDAVSIESSHGKARPTLPRAREVRVAPPADHRARDRDATGRFKPGNRAGTQRGIKLALAKLTGRYITGASEEAMAVAGDAACLLRAKLAESAAPDSASVRSLLALAATHEALAAFWFGRALLAGLDTERGIAAQGEATKHGQRAERLTVTAHDMAAKVASVRPRAAPWPSMLPAPRAVEAFDDDGDPDDGESGGGARAGAPLPGGRPPPLGDSGRPEGYAGSEAHLCRTTPRPSGDSAARPMDHADDPTPGRAGSGAGLTGGFRAAQGDYPATDRATEGAGEGSFRRDPGAFGSEGERNRRGFPSRSSRVESGDSFARENTGRASDGRNPDPFGLENTGNATTETRVSVAVGGEGTAPSGFDPTDRPDAAEIARRQAAALREANIARSGTRVVRDATAGPPPEAVRRMRRIQADAERAKRMKEGGGT